jgi:uncharacterized protein
MFCIRDELNRNDAGACRCGTRDAAFADLASYPIPLAHEHDHNPEMRPYKEAISAEKREKLIVGAAAGVIGIYRYFEAQRLLETQPFDNATTFRRREPKMGRNDPCPCGSGKKFKQCCGRTTLH